MLWSRRCKCLQAVITNIAGAAGEKRNTLMKSIVENLKLIVKIVINVNLLTMKVVSVADVCSVMDGPVEMNATLVADSK